MAKPTKYATPICTILTIIAVIGIVIGFIKNNPLILVLMVLPTVIYEVYRTEGKSTRWASWILLAVFILEIIFIAFKINFDLGAFLGKTQATVGGYNVPLGDIKIVGPVIIAVLSIILFIKTRGAYTKWLSVIIILSSFAVIYLLDTNIFQTLLKFGVDQGMDQVLNQIN